MQIEVGAAPVVRIVAERVAVEHAGQRRQRRRDLSAHAHAERGQRISGTARRHVVRGQRGPAEHRVDEERRVRARDEFLVDALLTDLHVDALVEERLLVPQLPQARRVFGFDSACRIQRAEFVGAQIAAMNLQRADVELAARQAERFLRIELDGRCRHTVVGCAAREAAAKVAENFAGFGNGKRHAVLAEPGAQAAHIAEHLLTIPEAGRRFRVRRFGVAFGFGRFRCGVGVGLRHRGAGCQRGAGENRVKGGAPHREYT